MTITDKIEKLIDDYKLLSLNYPTKYSYDEYKKRLAKLIATRCSTEKAIKSTYRDQMLECSVGAYKIGEALCEHLFNNILGSLLKYNKNLSLDRTEYFFEYDPRFNGGIVFTLLAVLNYLPTPEATVNSVSTLQVVTVISKDLLQDQHLLACLHNNQTVADFLHNLTPEVDIYATWDSYREQAQTGLIELDSTSAAAVNKFLDDSRTQDVISKLFAL